MSIIKADSLRKSYGSLAAVDGISFTVEQGECFGLLGANGAGKTTTLRTISGLQPVRGGKIYFNDQEITGASPEKLVNMGIAHVPEGRQIFRPMSVYDNLELVRLFNL